MLEARLHEFSTFITLTYAQENYPSDGSLNPTHVQKWLKRLRLALSSQSRSVRYYLVGEYGDETERAHYHAALFGVSPTEHDLISSTWGLGMVHLGNLTPESAQYIAGYVTKKMTAKDDSRLNGRYPEFARMSLRPGIGAGAVPIIANALNDVHGARSIAVSGDIPTALTHGKKAMPLGRYLRRKIRDELGFDNIGGQEKSILKQGDEMRALLNGSSSYTQGKAKLAGENFVKVRQLEGRNKIFKKVNKL